MIALYPVSLPEWKFSKKVLKNSNLTFPVVRCFTWKLELVSNILWLIVSGNLFHSNSSPDPFKHNFFDNFGNSKALHSVLT